MTWDFLAVIGLVVCSLAVGGLLFGLASMIVVTIHDRCHPTTGPKHFDSEEELAELPAGQRIALASILANAIAVAVWQMHHQHGATREEIIRALAAAAKAISIPEHFTIGE
jgi:hypothetical protein